MKTPNLYYQNKIEMSHRYSIYKDTVDLYKCLLIVEKKQDKITFKEMIKNKESNNEISN